MTLTLMPRIALAAAAALCVGACDEARGPTGPGVEIEVAPLSYPGLNRVCYDLTVLNGDPDGDDAPDVVWSEQGLCSDRYGNGAGGDISYVGPCDADVSGKNYVQLTVADVYVGATAVLLDQIDVGPGGSHEGEDDDYRNPCPTGAPCTLDFACLENRDVSVVFNLTVMRDANQGFFDVAVNFDDIFCSAKFDTCYPGEDPENADDDEYILQLHDATGQRRQTAVLGFACTGGALTTAEAASETHLYMNDIVISCPPASNGAELAVVTQQLDLKNAELSDAQAADIRYALDLSELEERLQRVRERIAGDLSDIGATNALIGVLQGALDQDTAELANATGKRDCLADDVTYPDYTTCLANHPEPVTEGADRQAHLDAVEAIIITLNADIAQAESRIRAQSTFREVRTQDLQNDQREERDIIEEIEALRRQVATNKARIDSLGIEITALEAERAAILSEPQTARSIALSPSAGSGGNVYTPTTTPAIDSTESGNVWQYAVYAGREQLNCGGTAPEYEPATVTWLS